jgi:hypothetical protein
MKELIAKAVVALNGARLLNRRFVLAFDRPRFCNADHPHDWGLSRAGTVTSSIGTPRFGASLMDWLIRHRDARRVALAQAQRSLRIAGRFAKAWSLRERGITLLSVSAARRHHEARVHDERGHMRVAPVISLLICLVGTAASGQTDRAAPSALAASSPSTAVVLTYKRDKRTKHREWRMKRHLRAQRKGGSSDYTLPPNLGIGIGIGM